MTSDLDIHSSAAVFIKQHGKRAWHEAARRSRRLWYSGDVEGSNVWVRIANAIEEMQKTEPAEGDTTH